MTHGGGQGSRTSTAFRAGKSLPKPKLPSLKSQELSGWLPHGAAAWIVIALAGTLALLAVAIATGSAASLDRSLLLGLRDPVDASKALGPTWLQIAARDITSLGSPAILTVITASAAGFLLLRQRGGEAALLVTAIATGALVSNGLKDIVGRARPDFVAEVAMTQTFSFPSGHAFLSALAFLTIGALLARSQPQRPLRIYLIATAIVLTFLVGVSRIYLGVHWPTDVIAGWCAGALWAFTWWGIEALLEERGLLRQRNGDIHDAI